MATAEVINSFYTSALYIIIGTIVIAVILIVSNILRFKHNLVIREVVNGRKIIIYDKARDYKDKTGVSYWKLRKKRDIIDMPPTSAIEVNHKGKKFVELYRLETGDYIYIKDISKINLVPQQYYSIKDTAKRKQLIEKWKQENKITDDNVIESFQPLTTKQRLILINQIRKAQERRTKRWQDYIMPVVGISAFLVLVVALMIFYGDIAKPVLEMGDKQLAYANIQKETLQIIQDIKTDTQTIRGQSGTDLTPPD